MDAVLVFRLIIFVFLYFCICAASALRSGRFKLSVRPHFELNYLLTTTERQGWRELEQPQVGPGGARRAGASESEDTEITEGVLFIRKLMHFIKNIFFISLYSAGYWLPCFYPDKILLIKLC
jgi:hypothetical protein